jgi:hypothetical protein
MELQKKICLYCKKEILPPDPNKVFISQRAWKIKKYCDIECRYKYFNAHRRETKRKNATTNFYYQRYDLKEFNKRIENIINKKRNG